MTDRTIENLSGTYAVLRQVAGQVDALLIQVARGVEQLEALRFEAVRIARRNNV